MVAVYGAEPRFGKPAAVSSAPRGVGKDGGSLVMKVAITSSSAAVNGQHLGAAQIGAGRFVDQLSDDRAALGDLAALRRWSRPPSRRAQGPAAPASFSGAVGTSCRIGLS